MARSNMTVRVVLTALTIGGLATGFNAPANAIGCISGGLAGAVAGHMVHHGVLGAIGGCVAGHQLNKRQKLQDTRDWNNPPPGNSDNRSSGYNGNPPPGGPYRGSN
jgi:hypothetical protein